MDKIIVFLHGWGANGADLMSLKPMLKLDHAHVYAPDAPSLSDVGYGYQWFSLNNRDPHVMSKLAEAAEAPLNHYLDGLLAKHDLPPEKLYLIGFSQGTMMALNVALHRKEKIGGVVGFSGALLTSYANSKPPICLIHGMEDQVVPFMALGHARQGLQTMGVPVETHAIPDLSHGIDPKGLELARHFLFHQPVEQPSAR